ncbi:hypothetical protein CLCR_07267 [Cladophialophora carrionii]|uniref:Fe2OG dioxygenase domain-containing protein n=1 Tax=Cladophialophora carrionii TaxID=86049 RepID=A0A1C1CN73_9EURO|nr:hypothetical protein CLCR_07267 [Cladophialophora carrionii]
MAPGILVESHTENRPTGFAKLNQASSQAATFDPVRHLAYVPPKSTHSFDDLCLPASPLSDVASTDPFPLLSEEALLEHRRELLSDRVLENCMYKTRPGSVQLRGMAPYYAPFIHQFWTSPEVLKIISGLAGIDLVPVFDYDICHTNIQLDSDDAEAVRKIPVIPPSAPVPEGTDESRTSVGSQPSATKHAVVPWHRDSYPFVCVVMLSDARYMTGGETEIQRGDGTTTKVRSPQMGGAVVLQGRHVSHIAIPTGNMPERITIVTSLRPRDPLLLESSSLMNVRNKSQLPELYYQWSSYRLHLLSERFRLEAERLDVAHRKEIQATEGGKGSCKTDIVDLAGLQKWMDEQMMYMKRTLFEMRPVTAEDSLHKNEIQEMTM